MQRAAVSSEEPGARLLRIVAELNRELHPRRSLFRITLDSRFDRDLGFDSLARMELMLRVERAFGCGLPEKLLAAADSPRDFLDALSDAEAAVGRLRSGEALVVFAEGTLRHAAGLLPFHLGGFMAAARLRVPVVPLAIRGTRTVLRSDQWFPRRGPVTASVGEPVTVPADAGSAFAGALALRDQARKHILEHCGEPDLAD